LHIFELALTLKERHDRQQTNSKMTEKMPTLRKIKRTASRYISERFCNTFNFAQPHPSPPTTQHEMNLKQKGGDFITYQNCSNVILYLSLDKI